jgi:hypothetical protein
VGHCSSSWSASPASSFPYSGSCSYFASKRSRSDSSLKERLGDFAAEVAKRCEDGYHVPAEAPHLSLIQWKDFKGQIAQLEAEAPELWQELEDTYGALRQTKARGASPPQSPDLLKLADRLEEAAEGE